MSSRTKLRPSKWNRTAVALNLASVVVLMASVILAHREFIPPQLGVTLFAGSGAMGLTAAIMSAIGIWRSQAWYLGMLGMIGLLPVIVNGAAMAEGLRYPPVNDVTTGLDDIPRFIHARTLPENAGADMDFPQKWIGIMRVAFPDLAPAIVARPHDQVFLTVLRQAETTRDWEVTYSDPATGHIEAVATTLLWRFPHDVVIRVSDAGNGTTRVDMRSRSREGRLDFGTNAKRIRAFLERVR
jgi:hypothetical protein